MTTRRDFESGAFAMTTQFLGLMLDPFVDGRLGGFGDDGGSCALDRAALHRSVAANVAVGSNATEPFGAAADQCLLSPTSDQIGDKMRMTKGAHQQTSSASSELTRYQCDDGTDQRLTGF